MTKYASLIAIRPIWYLFISDFMVARLRVAAHRVVFEELDKSPRILAHRRSRRPSFQVHIFGRFASIKTRISHLESGRALQYRAREDATAL